MLSPAEVDVDTEVSELVVKVVADVPVADEPVEDEIAVVEEDVELVTTVLEELLDAVVEETPLVEILVVDPCCGRHG